MHPSAIRAIAFLAGLVYAAGFWPWPFWWLTITALAVLPACVLRARQGAGWIGLAFGLGCFVAGLSWLYISMHRYGGMPAPLAALALLLFAGWLALFPVLACCVLQRCAVGPGRTKVTAARYAGAIAACFAGAWTLAEMLRGWLLTGFPWLAAGYAQVDGPLSSFAPWLGVYGVSTMAALSASGIGLAVTGRNLRAPGILLALVPVAGGLALAQIDWTSAHGEPVRIRLVQGNIAQDLKFDPQRTLAAMQWYAGQVAPAPMQLTVLPETAWTVPWQYTPWNVRETLLAALSGGGRLAIGMPLSAQAQARARFPAPDADEPRRITNSAALIDANGSIAWRYDKRHLVPFGEFVPPGFRWFVDLMQIPLGDFARGSADQPPFVLGTQKLAFDICYEDLFGEEIAAQVRQGATILINVSNIAWFGDSHALPQHLQIARMRALETARPMLRATNTGVTAAIDADGSVLAQLPPYTAGVLDVTVQGQDRLTPAARYGNLPALILALALLAVGAGVLRSR